MNKNRISATLIVLAVVATAIATSSFTSATAVQASRDDYALRQRDTAPGASDYFMRHPELKGSLAAGASDYFVRHPEVKIGGIAAGASDYFMRHPELVVRSQSTDTTDYAVRQRELSAK